MDDLRWILLLVGTVVVAAIYFSGRFESEDWARERKQSSEGRRGKVVKKARKRRASSKLPAVAERTVVKKEPRMETEQFESVKKASEQTEPLDMPLKNTRETKPSIESVEAVVLNDEAPPVKPAPATLRKPLAENAHKSAQIKPSGIEDEITDVEIPRDLAVLEAEIQVAGNEPTETPEHAEMPLAIEPLVLSMSVLAEEGESFAGQEIKEAMEAEGLVHGTMRIYHFYAPENKAIAGSDDAVFSIANLLEPGSFDLENLDETHTPGLMLFCQLPGPLSGDDALEVMLDKGRGLAVRLHGYMCDDKRNRFTTQAKNHYLDRIAVFERELVLARSKSPAS